VYTGSRVVTAIVKAPLEPGFYSGYIVVEEVTKGVKMLVPVSFFVPLEIRSEIPYTLTPFTENTTRRNTYLRGVFDYTWRYESGDWRIFKVTIYPSLIFVKALGVKVTWPVLGDPNYASNLDVHVYGPYKYYMVDWETNRVYEYNVNGVQLAAELSRDPRGGGGYNPTRFWDTIGPGESLVVTPVLYSGVYRVVVRNIQFSGLDFEEPFTLEIIPVSIRVGWTYSYLEKSYVFTITLKTSDIRLIPVDLVIDENAVVTIEPGVNYYVNLTEQGFIVYVKSIEVVEGVFKTTLVISPPETAVKGLYTVAVGLVTIIPVTTVGWYDRGSRVVYFEWPITQVYLKFPLT
jgi:hypothetical protein